MAQNEVCFSSPHRARRPLPTLNLALALTLTRIRTRTCAQLSLELWRPPAKDVELPAAGACGFEPETAPPAHMGGDSIALTVQRDADGHPVASEFKANVVRPDEVPGAYQAWLENQ